MHPVAFVFMMVFAFAFGVGGLALLLEHREKMARIRASSLKEGGKELAETLDSIRREIAELRDTTTRYDVSFDSALQRMESRVAHLEKGARQTPAEDSATIRQTVGQG